MANSWRTIRDAVGIWGGGVVLLGIGLFVAFQFVGPPPPAHIVMVTGAEGGAYRSYGQKFADRLAIEGIEVELRETAGAVENLMLLQSDETVAAGFVQGGLAGSFPVEGVMGLGSMYFEPLWIFVRADAAIEDLGDLAAKRIAGGAPGSGTRAVVKQLLGLSGHDAAALQFLDTASADLIGAFNNDELDVAMLIGAHDSDSVRALIHAPNLVLLDIVRADAYVRYLPYMSRVLLPEGVLDLADNLPAEEVTTVAVTAMLAARKDLHPAIVDLLLVSAGEIFGGHSLLADAGQFPTGRYTDLPLGKQAKRYYERGSPFLMRYLPFWAATLVDRLWVLLLPFIGLAIPLGKLLPPVYRWRIRRRLLSRYAALDAVDPFGHPVVDEEDRGRRLEKLSQLDSESAGEIVPRSYVDDVYKLRRDIDLVRRRLVAEQAAQTVKQ